MKKITFFVLMGIAVSFMSCDNDSNASQKVKDTFAMKFPNATNVEWEKESDTEWEAEFKLNGKEHSSNFMQDGTWIETEYEVSESEIPQVVMDAMNTNFEGYEIEGMELTETKDGKAYEMAIEKGESNMEVIIDANGKIIKKENKQEDNENEDDETDND